MRPVAIAIDYGGTLTAERSRPDAQAIVGAMRDFDIDVEDPQRFADELVTVYEQVRALRCQGASGVKLAKLLQLACHRSEIELAPAAADEVAELVYERLPDSRIDPRAAAAVREISVSGVRVVMAANTGHSRLKREQTLRDGEIDDCFDELVLSWEIGHRKPEPKFYAAVIAACQCPANQILFVGDRIPEDVLGPLDNGMRAALVHTGPTPPHLPVPDGVPVLQHVEELPALLRGSA